MLLYVDFLRKATRLLSLPAEYEGNFLGHGWVCRAYRGMRWNDTLFILSKVPGRLLVSSKSMSRMRV
jgi:hypothetical protein